MAATGTLNSYMKFDEHWKYYPIQIPYVNKLKDIFVKGCEAQYIIYGPEPEITLFQTLEHLDWSIW